jgi:hypothetical protein
MRFIESVDSPDAGDRSGLFGAKIESVRLRLGEPSN